MSRYTFYKYATWSLLLLNLALLAFFFLRKPPHGLSSQGPGFQNEIVRRLHLDEPQEVAFITSAENHFQQMNSLREQQQKLLLPYFESLTTTTTVAKDSLLNEFEQLERQKIEVTYQHFEEVKAMLNEEQVPHFNEVVQRFIDRLLLGRNK